MEMDRVAAKTGVPFLRHLDLGVLFPEKDFREQSHLNYAGAEKLGAALADRVIVPMLAGGAPRTATPQEIAAAEKALEDEAAREKAAQEAAPRPRPPKRKGPAHAK